MPAVFGRYARHYDLLYRDKPYEAECDALEDAFRTFASSPVRAILDVACGTGGHTIPLARRGYAVDAVDASPVMLGRAKEKAAAAAGAGARFHEADMRSLEIPRQFDAVICLFAGLGYLTETDDLLTALRAFRRHARPGGLLVLDVWNGLAVVSIGPSARTRRVEDGALTVVRSTRPEVDLDRRVCRNIFHLTVLDRGRVIDEMEEVHDMRFFFPQELAHDVTESGFEVLRLGGFPRLERPVEPSEWTLGLVARARP